MIKRAFRRAFRRALRRTLRRALKREFKKELKRAFKKPLKGIPLEADESEPCSARACSLYVYSCVMIQEFVVLRSKVKYK